MSTFVEGKKYKVVGNKSGHWYKIGSKITALKTTSGNQVNGCYWFSGIDRSTGNTLSQVLDPEDVADINFLPEAKEKKMKQAKPTSGKQNLWLVESTTKSGKVQTYTRATRAEARLTKNCRKAVGDTDVRIVRFERTQVVR